MSLFSGLRVIRLNRLALVVFLLSMATTSLWSQNTIRVPEDQPTIQDALGVANDGDTVLVAPGTYFENLFFFNIAVTVKSSAGPDATIIDGGGLGPVAAFQVSQGPGTVLSGFTIRNGSTRGGVFVSFASPTITNNIITNNAACGIYLRVSSAVVANNTIASNPMGCAASVGGAGITIEGNGSPLITGNTIINNGTSGSSGDIFDGGGIGVGGFSGTPSPVITNNTIKTNQAARGGGIMLRFLAANAVITQNLIVENVAQFGGGVAINSGSGSLTSNTIANNAGLSEGSGVFIDNFTLPLSLINNVIVGRSGSTALFCNTFSPDFILANNDVFAPAGLAYGGACPDVTGVNGNISADPMFADVSNYHLQPGTPAIDQGTNAAPNLLQNDIEGQLRILDGNEDGVAVVDMGAYERALVEFSPSPLNFGSQGVGTSVTLPLTLTNRSSLTLRPVPELTGDIQDFRESNDCFDLAPGASCTFNFTFTPQVLGPRSAVLKVSRLDGKAMLPLAILSLRGEGVGAGPVPIELTIDPPSVDFAPQLVGTTSGVQLVSLNTPSGAPQLMVTESTITGPFQHVVNCSAAVVCHIEVTFTPTARGTATGTISIHSNAVGSPHTVPLSGIGIAPAASLSPTTLDFGAQAVGSTSSHSLTLTNNGDATLHISGIEITGDFGHIDTCFGVLAAGASCLINVTFTPTATGERSGTLTISSDSEDLLPVVALVGRGAVPVAVVTPDSLSFGNQRLGVSSAPQTVTLSNAGEVALHISQISVVGEFAQTNGCAATLEPGAACSIAVTFTPTTVGFRNGFVVISNNDPGAEPSVTVALSGTGVVPVASLSPVTLVFGSQVLNTTSAAQAAILSNTSGATLQLFGISVSGDFAQTNACGTQLAAGASCVINVTFIPSATGTRVGTLAISSDGSQQPLVVNLSGTGVTSAPTLAPTSIAFKDTNIGKTAHPSKTVILTANGPGPLQILAITISGDFSQTNNCPALLNAGSTCSISVSFTPSAVGTRTGSLNVMHNGLGSPHSVFLSGTGKSNGKGQPPLRRPRKF